LYLLQKRKLMKVTHSRENHLSSLWWLNWLLHLHNLMPQTQTIGKWMMNNGISFTNIIQNMVADLMIFWCGSIHKQKLKNKETQFILVNHNMVLSSPKMMMRMILIELWVLKQIKWIIILKNFALTIMEFVIHYFQVI
jgi:hypothetical protein